MHSFILPAIVMAASSFLHGVQADTYPGLPACAQTCAVGPIENKCGSLTRDYCTCFESGIQSIIQCITSACSCSDSTIAVGVFQTVCTPQGLTLPGVTCTTSSSSSPSTPSTPTPPFGGGNATAVTPSGSSTGGGGGVGGTTTSAPANGSPTASPTVVLPSGSSTGGAGGAGGAGGSSTGGAGGAGGSTPANGSPTASPTGPSTASPSPFKGAAAIVQAGWFVGVVAAAGVIVVL